MESKSQNNKSTHDINLEELSKNSKPIYEIPLRIEQAKKRQELASLAARRRMIRQFLFILSVLFVGGISVFSFIYYRGSFTPLPVLNKPFMAVSVPIVEDTYQLVKAEGYLPGIGKFQAHTFDFDSNRFLKGRDVLTNPDVLKSTFRQPTFQYALQNRWVVIFAGASFEGNEEHNRNLCRRRVRGVFEILTHTEGIIPRGYWGIRAGEYREILPNSTSPLSEEEEERQARKVGEQKLAGQRRLIIIAIGPASLEHSFENGNRIVVRVVAMLREKNIIPHIYDYAISEPSRLH